MLNFPQSPTLDQIYSSGSSATYKWNGSNWIIVTPPIQVILTARSASYASSSLSSSYATTASFALNGGGGGTILITGSNPTSSATTGSLWWNSENGNLYVKVSGSSGGAAWVPATNTVAGGNYGNTLVSTNTGSVWNINHNLNTTSPIVIVYSGSNIIIPVSIVSTDANNTTITFSQTSSGTAVLSTGVGSATAALATTASFATTASYINMPYGQILPPQQTTANLNNTWADITSGSFTLTQAGTYEIIYNFTIGNSTSNWVAAGLFDSANTYLSGSGTLVTSTTSNGISVSSGVFVTITTPTTYKIRVKTFNTTAITVYQSEPIASASGGSILRWKKIT